MVVYGYDWLKIIVNGYDWLKIYHVVIILVHG